jgi:hypothetical protein
MRSLQTIGEVRLDERKFDTSRLKKGGRPGPTPIDKAHWRFRIARQANMAQCEAEIGDHLGDFGLTLPACEG